MEFFNAYDKEKFDFVDSPTYWTDNSFLISSVVQVSLGEKEKNKALEESSEFNALQVEFLYNLLRARATKAPLMIVIDNAQWLDQASLSEFTHSTIERSKVQKSILYHS